MQNLITMDIEHRFFKSALIKIESWNPRLFGIYWDWVCSVSLEGVLPKTVQDSEFVKQITFVILVANEE